MSTATKDLKDKEVSENGKDTEVTQPEMDLSITQSDIDNLTMVFSLARKGNGTEDEDNLAKLILFKTQLITKLQSLIKK